MFSKVDGLRSGNIIFFGNREDASFGFVGMVRNSWHRGGVYGDGNIAESG